MRNSGSLKISWHDVNPGSACNSVRTELSHVLQAIEADAAYATGTIRISLGKDNTEEETVRIAEALLKILAAR